MKIPYVFLSTCVMLVIILSYLTGYEHREWNSNGKIYNQVTDSTYIIDLPEEFPEISKNSKNPDLMVAHMSGDTLYLRFKLKNQDYGKITHPVEILKRKNLSARQIANAVDRLYSRAQNRDIRTLIAKAIRNSLEPRIKKMLSQRWRRNH